MTAIARTTSYITVFQFCRAEISMVFALLNLKLAVLQKAAFTNSDYKFASSRSNRISYLSNEDNDDYSVHTNFISARLWRAGFHEKFYDGGIVNSSR